MILNAVTSASAEASARLKAAVMGRFLGQANLAVDSVAAPVADGRMSAIAQPGLDGGGASPLANATRDGGLVLTAPSYDLEQPLDVANNDDAPVAELEAAPMGDRELALSGAFGSAQAATAPDGASVLQALRAFVTGTDVFDFSALIPTGDEAAPVVLDPFVDAIDPAWMGEVLANLLIDPDLVIDDVPETPEPAIDINPDVDGWVV